MKLNDRVSLTREKTTLVPGGGREKRFGHLRYLYCDITFFRMKNKYQFNQEIKGNVITVKTRATRDISRKDRIVYDNIQYEIKSIAPLKKEKNHIEILCEEIWQEGK